MIRILIALLWFAALLNPTFAAKQVCQVDGTMIKTIPAALTICNGNDAVIIVETNQNLSSSLPSITIVRNGVHILCNNDVVLHFGIDRSIIFTGDNDSLENCTLTGNGITHVTSPPVIVRGTNFLARHNNISDFGYTNVQGIIGNGLADNSNLDGLVLDNNTLFNNGDLGVLFGGNGTFNKIKAINNTIDNGIYFVPGSSGGNDFVISDNILSYGGGNVTANMPGNISASCIEVIGAGASPGGALVNDLSSSNNTCSYSVGQPANGSECYGYGNLYGFNIFNNTCKSNGLLVASGFIEVNQGQVGLVSGNRTENTSGSGILCYNCNYVTISNNVINGFGIGSETYGIIMTTNSPVIMGYNSIIGNTIIFGGGSARTGILMSCRVIASTCVSIEITGNHIISDGTASSIGIHIERHEDPSNVSGLLVGPNTIRAPAIGVLVDAAITLICLVPGHNSSATPVTNNGAASSCN